MIARYSVMAAIPVLLVTFIVVIVTRWPAWLVLLGWAAVFALVVRFARGTLTLRLSEDGMTAYLPGAARVVYKAVALTEIQRVRISAVAGNGPTSYMVRLVLPHDRAEVGGSLRYFHARVIAEGVAKLVKRDLEDEALDATIVRKWNELDTLTWDTSAPAPARPAAMRVALDAAPGAFKMRVPAAGISAGGVLGVGALALAAYALTHGYHLVGGRHASSDPIVMVIAFGIFGTIAFVRQFFGAEVAVTDDALVVTRTLLGARLPLRRAMPVREVEEVLLGVTAEHRPERWATSYGDMTILVRSDRATIELCPAVAGNEAAFLQHALVHAVLSAASRAPKAGG